MILRVRLIVAVGLLAAACRASGPRLEQAAPAPSDSTCTLAVGPAARRDTVTVAVTPFPGPEVSLDPLHAASRVTSATRDAARIPRFTVRSCCCPVALQGAITR